MELPWSIKILLLCWRKNTVYKQDTRGEVKRTRMVKVPTRS
jgi:hypothetical protein